MSPDFDATKPRLPKHVSTPARQCISSVVLFFSPFFLSSRHVCLSMKSLNQTQQQYDAWLITSMHSIGFPGIFLSFYGAIDTPLQ